MRKFFFILACTFLGQGALIIAMVVGVLMVSLMDFVFTGNVVYLLSDAIAARLMVALTVCVALGMTGIVLTSLWGGHSDEIR